MQMTMTIAIYLCITTVPLSPSTVGMRSSRTVAVKILKNGIVAKKPIRSKKMQKNR